MVHTCQSWFLNFFHSVSPLVSIHLFSMSVSLFLLCRLDHLYYFSNFLIYVLIYDICFSLSDSLHSVWQTLGPSTSPQRTQFCSYLWLRNILLCHIYVTHLYPFTYWWTFMLFPYPDYDKQCCSEHWGAYILWNYGFLWVYAEDYMQFYLVTLLPVRIPWGLLNETDRLWWGIKAPGKACSGLS